MSHSLVHHCADRRTRHLQTHALTLPGGEQQRVAAARALPNSPSLILADEPTAALDSPPGRQVIELFAKIALEKNAGVIFVTQDHRTLDVLDRILDVEDGMIQVHVASPHQAHHD